MIQNLTKKRNDEGFTLIELLVVVVILGILAAVVVFAVGGINSKGETAACKSDTKTIRTAQEAHYAKTGEYADTTSDLKTAGFLGEPSTLHEIGTVTPASGSTAASYTIIVTAAGEASKCGTEDGVVGTGSNI